MKALQFVVLAVVFVSATCLENLEDLSSLKQDFSLNQGEFYPQEEFNAKLREFDNQFGYKLKTKKYIPQEPKQRVQYTIIKRTHEVPFNKKYGGRSSAEQVSYHNKHPSKYSYSVAHKPKVLPVRVVQEGSVKHIYLDMPDLFEDKPKVPNFENVKQFNNQQYNSYAPFEHQQQQYQAPVQYFPAQNLNPAAGFHQESNEHAFNLPTSYNAGKSSDVNALVQNLQQQFSNGLGNQQTHIPQTQSFGNTEFDSLKTDYSNANSEQFTQNSDYSQIKPDYNNANTAQFTPDSNSQFAHQFPQYSADGTEKYTYEIPEQYKSLFANNPYAAGQFGQSEFKPSVGYQQEQQHNFGKTARMSSAFNPDLDKIVKDVLNKGQEYSNDGFKMVKSNDEKAVYLVGKPGMSLDAVPNLGSFSFSAKENSQPGNNKFV